MKKEYILSIVIPTKNRYPYLFQLIELIESFNYDEIELIIQDNTEDNSLFLEYLENHQYKHLKYFHIKEQISVSENSTEAILNSTGEYVCFIGDDDGVTRYIVDAVKWMKDNNITTLKSAGAILKWPSYISTSYYKVSGTAIFNDFSMTYKIVDAKACLKKLLTTGISTLDFMPKTYNGITKRTTLEKIYKKCGTYFPGPSPDMANAVTLALEDDFYAFVDAPIIIGGHSGHLGGNASRYKRQCGPLEEQPFISKVYIDNRNPRIPKVWSPTTIWPASAITALQAYKVSEYLGIVDYEKILDKFIVANPDKTDMALALSKNPSALLKSSQISKLKRLVRGCLNVLLFIIFNKYDGKKVHRGISNIMEAEKLITDKIRKFDLKQG